MELDFLIENSNPSYASQGLVTLLYEANSTDDIASYKMMLGKLIQRSEKVSVYDEMVNTIPVAIPEGKLPTIGLKYDAQNDTDWKNTVVLYVDGSIGAVGDPVTSSGGATGTILYIEDDVNDSVTTLKVLVDVTSGTFVQGETINITVNILSVFTNIVGTGNLLSDYDGEWATNVAEFGKDTLNQYKAQVGVSDFICKTRQARTEITAEFIQDVKNVFKARGVQTIINMLYNAMDKQLEQRIIKIIRGIATQKPNIHIVNDGTEIISIRDQYYEIYSRIGSSKNRIGTATNIQTGFFVIASSNVVANLQTILEIKPYTKKDNSNATGYLPNGALLIEDGYSLDDYFAVGTKGIEENVNGGLIYTPYSYDLVDAVNPDTLQTVLVPLHRYDVVRNNLDTKKALANQSDFFETTIVTYADITKV